MGYMAHHAVLVTVSEYATDDPDWMPDVEAFRRSLPEEWRPLVVGPVTSAINGYHCYVAFLPDGSKEGWGTSDDGERYRRQFTDLFAKAHSDGSSPFDVALVRFGGDEPELASVTYPNDPGDVLEGEVVEMAEVAAEALGAPPEQATSGGLLPPYQAGAAALTGGEDGARFPVQGCERCRALASDPHPGLLTWNEAVARHMEAEHAGLATERSAR